MERGGIMPSIPRLIQLAEILDCKTTDFLIGSSPRLIDQLERMHDILSRLDELEREKFLDMVESMVDWHLNHRWAIGGVIDVLKPYKPLFGEICCTKLDIIWEIRPCPTAYAVIMTIHTNLFGVFKWILSCLTLCCQFDGWVKFTTFLLILYN